MSTIANVESSPYLSGSERESRKKHPDRHVLLTISYQTKRLVKQALNSLREKLRGKEKERYSCGRQSDSADTLDQSFSIDPSTCFYINTIPSIRQWFRFFSIIIIIENNFLKQLFQTTFLLNSFYLFKHFLIIFLNVFKFFFF